LQLRLWNLQEYNNYLAALGGTLNIRYLRYPRCGGSKDGEKIKWVPRGGESMSSLAQIGQSVVCNKGHLWR